MFEAKLAQLGARVIHGLSDDDGLGEKADNRGIYGLRAVLLVAVFVPFTRNPFYFSDLGFMLMKFGVI